MAVKLFRDQSTKSSDADAEEGDSPGYEEAMAEKKNNDLVKHSHIVPMLTMFNHRGYRMAIYPLGRASFDNVLKTSELTRYIGTIEHVADQMGNLFSALDTMHRGIPDTCGFHLDIKYPLPTLHHIGGLTDIPRPANILLLLDNSFALIDLGSAHFKPDMQKTNPAFSATKRRDFSLEYSGPESLVHRTFDVWSMGAVFCELLVLIDEGPTGVAAFRQSRKAKRGIQTVYDFHAENRVKPVVLEKLQDLAKKHRKNRVFVGSVDVVRLLLSPDQAERQIGRAHV